MNSPKRSGDAIVVIQSQDMDNDGLPFNELFLKQERITKLQRNRDFKHSFNFKM